VRYQAAPQPVVVEDNLTIIAASDGVLVHADDTRGAFAEPTATHGGRTVDPYPTHRFGS
jgi:hypothetical protein